MDANRLAKAHPADSPPSLEQAARWLAPSDLAELGRLMAAAAELRQAHCGEAVELCAIINAKSGRCSEDCAFCAQSARHQTQADYYALLDLAAILAASRRAADDGAVRFSVVTSGRDCPDGAELDAICRAVEAMRREGRVKPCASLGLLTPAQARRLADAGLVRYHHNLETGPGYFPQVCTSHAYEDRVATVTTARAAGLEVCVGGIVGMGESPAQRAELALAIGGLAPESVPLNFLNPVPGTRLEGLTPMRPIEALAAVAVFRLCAPRAALRCCGGRAQVLGALSPMMYLAGADAVMTGDYLTTSGQSPQDDRREIAALGLELAAI